MKDHYVKDYKEKELRQFILAYLLITVASIALHTDFSADNADLLDTLLKMAAMDIWVSGLSVLVVILNEIWPDAMKTKIVYGSMPSDTIFSEIAAGKRSFCFDLDAAKEKYKDLSALPPDKQSAEWYKLLHAGREAECGNVIEGQRMQLMTRDIRKANEPSGNCIWTFVQINNIDFILRETFFLILKQTVDSDCFVSRYRKQIVCGIAVTQIVAFIFVFHRVNHNCCSLVRIRSRTDIAGFEV